MKLTLKWLNIYHCYTRKKNFTVTVTVTVRKNFCHRHRHRKKNFLSPSPSPWHGYGDHGFVTAGDVSPSCPVKMAEEGIKIYI